MNAFLKLLITIPALLTNVACKGQIKNAKTISVAIDGNCDMCEKTIETAANVKHTASLSWNKETKLAELSYDPGKTSPDEILKRVAYAGYDNEAFLAPDEAYTKLPSCCKYERTRKKSPEIKKGNAIAGANEQSPANQAGLVNPFESIYSTYFELKNALIKADANAASTSAAALVKGLTQVDMNKLESSQHTVWMTVYKSLIAASEGISKSKDMEQQRNQFMDLSENMHALAKVAKLNAPVYYQHCPMYNDGKGANWLSMENTVKNPYYGSQMLSCGKTVETIK